MQEISPTQEKVALIDDEDYELVSQYKWHVSRRGKHKLYASTGIKAGSKKTKVDMHRLIINAPKGQQVDHKNGNGLDNRKENLRVCTRSQNQRNRVANRTRGTSKYKGVSFDKKSNSWRAKISIGSFPSEEEAARAYDEVAGELFGEFAKLNFLEL